MKIIEQEVWSKINRIFIDHCQPVHIVCAYNVMADCTSLTDRQLFEEQQPSLGKYNGYIENNSGHGPGVDSQN